MYSPGNTYNTLGGKSADQKYAQALQQQLGMFKTYRQLSIDNQIKNYDQLLSQLEMPYGNDINYVDACNAIFSKYSKKMPKPINKFTYNQTMFIEFCDKMISGIETLIQGDADTWWTYWHLNN